MKVVCFNKKGNILLIGDQLPNQEDFTFGEILVSLVVYDPSAKVKYLLALDWKRTTDFPKNTVYKDQIVEVKKYLKD